jgi:hypothetical protein
MAKNDWDSKLRSGYDFGEVSSALQKCIRRGLEFEAMLWARILCDEGYDLYVWKRLCIIAVEDIGLAAPMVSVVVNSLRQMWEAFRKKNKDGTWKQEVNILGMAILLMCRSNKNRCADDFSYLVCSAMEGRDIRDGSYGNEKLRLKIPDFAIDGHTERGKQKLRDKHGNNWFVGWNKEFYEDVARLNKPVKVKGIDWSRIVANKAGCSIKKYETPCEGGVVFKGQTTNNSNRSYKQRRKR